MTRSRHTAASFGRALAGCFIASSVVAMGLGACDIAKTGADGNFKFQYTADDRIVPPTFNRPIAKGLRVEVKVTDAQTNDPIAVSTADSDRTSVMTVPQKSGSRVILEGRAAGSATLTVRSSAGVSDSIAVEVASIDSVTLTNPGPVLKPVEGTPSVILGADIPFPMVLKDADNRALVGFGDIPVEIDPPSAGTRVQSDDIGHVVLRFSEAGEVMVRPDNGPPVPVKVVDAAEVVSIELEPLAGSVFADVKLGGLGWIALSGATTDGARAVGLAEVATVESQSIAVCRLALAPTLGDGVFTIEPLAVGDCNLKAELNGQVSEVSVKVVQGDS